MARRPGLEDGHCAASRPLRVPARRRECAAEVVVGDVSDAIRIDEGHVPEEGRMMDVANAIVILLQCTTTAQRLGDARMGPSRLRWFCLLKWRADSRMLDRAHSTIIEVSGANLVDLYYASLANTCMSV